MEVTLSLGFSRMMQAVTVTCRCHVPLANSQLKQICLLDLHTCVVHTYSLTVQVSKMLARGVQLAATQNIIYRAHIRRDISATRGVVDLLPTLQCVKIPLTDILWFRT